MDPALAAEALAGGASPLTGREADVLRAASAGGTVADIARALRLSQGTVRNHLSSAIGKTRARTRAEAARLAETQRLAVIAAPVERLAQVSQASRGSEAADVAGEPACGLRWRSARRS
ncbi:regulatory protein, luxR family [Streptomyces sp. DvalAA-43]|nr:regulatory protein, luxR family [Streptomyces sp. DvalAA-43]